MKGAALQSMVYWVGEVAEEDAHDHHGELVAFTFKSFEKADKICRNAGRHFTEKEHALYCRHMENALVSYNALAVEAGVQGKHNWKMLPKFHACCHYYDTRVNPRRVQCYQDEDMAGRVKRFTSPAMAGRHQRGT